MPKTLWTVPTQVFHCYSHLSATVSLVDIQLYIQVENSGHCIQQKIMNTVQFSLFRSLQWIKILKHIRSGWKINHKEKQEGLYQPFCSEALFQMETISCLLGDRPYKRNLIYNGKCIAPGVAMIHSSTQPTITESVIRKRMSYENSRHQQVLCRLLVNMTFKINTYSFWKKGNLLWKNDNAICGWTSALKAEVANTKCQFKCFSLRIY